MNSVAISSPSTFQIVANGKYIASSGGVTHIADLPGYSSGSQHQVHGNCHDSGYQIYQNDYYTHGGYDCGVGYQPEAFISNGYFRPELQNQEYFNSHFSHYADKYYNQDLIYNDSLYSGYHGNQHDYSVYNSGQDYSVYSGNQHNSFYNNGQDYSIYNGYGQDYSVYNNGYGQDYSVYNGNQHDSFYNGYGQDYSVYNGNQWDYGQDCGLVYNNGYDLSNYMNGNYYNSGLDYNHNFDYSGFGNLDTGSVSQWGNTWNGFNDCLDGQSLGNFCGTDYGLSHQCAVPDTGFHNYCQF